MTSKDNDNKKEEDTQIKKAKGIHGWLLKKAKTFMWDAKSNTLVLPEGVVLSLEEKEALKDVIDNVVDEAEEVSKRRNLQNLAMAQQGVKFKSDVVKGYSILINGTYRELTGILAHKIHNNLKQTLLINQHFVSNTWKKILSGIIGKTPKLPPQILKNNNGRD